MLTQNDQKADQNRRQGAHTKLQGLTLLHQLTVLAPETVGTNATISQAGLEINASGTVHTGHIEALVAIHTALGIGRHNASFAATIFMFLYDKLPLIKVNT